MANFPLLARPYLLLRGFAQLSDQNLSVGVEAAAGGGLGFLHWICGQDVSDFRDQSRGSESFFDVVALEVDVGIDLVREAVVALILFEADIVGGGADPERSAVDLEGRLPYAQVIAGSDDGRWVPRGPSRSLAGGRRGRAGSSAW